MTSLDPLVRLLVQTLSEQDPARLHRPMPLNELMDAVLPYRIVRRELGVDTAEDYETLLLRLCAGEGEFLQADPAAQSAMAAELRKPLPDLGLLRVWGDTHIILRTDPLLDAIEEDPEVKYAPPHVRRLTPEPASPTSAKSPKAKPDAEWHADPVIELHTPSAAEPPADADRVLEEGKAAVRCPFCGGLLPPRMAINFCPHCGMGQDVGACRTCGADVDVGWRYCVSCGEEIIGDGT